MDIQEINELRALLPQGRTLFAYYKDKYSLQLLRYAVPRPTPVAALRQQPAGQLLQKPLLKPVLAACGGTLKREQIDWADVPAAPQHYALTLGNWGWRNNARAMQTSRRGANLVLQLNFSHAHNREFRRLIRPLYGEPFACWGHPILRDNGKERRYTLAWARLDIDFEAGEALIEELQNDWLRQARRIRDIAADWDEEAFKKRYCRCFAAGREEIIVYHDEMLAPHRAIWDEALLSAVLFFLREELGMRDIWMHTPQSGVMLKKIRGSAPPVSLYSTLPKRFCFQPDDSVPGFLAREREAARQLRRKPDVRLQRFLL